MLWEVAGRKEAVLLTAEAEESQRSEPWTGTGNGGLFWGGQKAFQERQVH